MIVRQRRRRLYHTPDKLVGPFRAAPADVVQWCQDRIRNAGLEIFEVPMAMHRRSDLTGLNFGTNTKRFIVLGYAGRRKGSRARPHLWYVGCECLRIITVPDKTLRAGRLTRCPECVRTDTTACTYNRRRDERRKYRREHRAEIERAEIAAEAKRAQEARGRRFCRVDFATEDEMRQASFGLPKSATPPLRDLRGQRYGRLRVIGFAGLETPGDGTTGRWYSVCDCGATGYADEVMLGGAIPSCGCVASEVAHGRVVLRTD